MDDIFDLIGDVIKGVSSIVAASSSPWSSPADLLACCGGRAMKKTSDKKPAGHIDWFAPPKDKGRA